MKTPRSLDLDGLDGIMPSSDKRQPKSAGLKVIWAALFISLVAIIQFFTLSQRHSSLISPEKPAQPIEKLPAEAADTVTAEPVGKVDPLAAMATNMVAMPATEASASANSLQTLQTSGDQAPDELILPPEPAAAGNPTGTALFTVYFGLMSSTPIPLSDAEITHLIDFAKSCKKRTRITGHTCSLGSAELNLRLGQLRADAVKKLLVANGISAPQIETASEGENQPATSNDTFAGRVSNRRAELSCLDQ